MVHFCREVELWNATLHGRCVCCNDLKIPPQFIELKSWRMICESFKFAWINEILRDLDDSEDMN